MTRKCPYCEGAGEITVGLVVKRARKARRLTQDSLAAKVGISRPAIVNIELGRQAITVERLRKFSEALGVEIDLLIP